MAFRRAADTEGTLETIRSRYDELGLTRPNVRPLKSLFENRLRSALSGGRDINQFLEEEKEFIGKVELRGDALEREHEHARQMREERENGDDDSFLNRELGKLSEHIEKYPGLLPEDVCPNQEISRLFGAIDRLDREYWQTIGKYMHERFPIRAKSPMEIVESRLWSMVPAQVGRAPNILSYYCDNVRRGNNAAADEAAFNAIKEAALFLNDLRRLLEDSGFSKEEAVFVYLKGVITDFRLGNIRNARRIPID